MNPLDEEAPGLSFARLKTWIASPVARGLALILIVSVYPVAIGSLQPPPEGFELPVAPWIWDLLVGSGVGLSLALCNLIRVPVSLVQNFLVWVFAALSGALLPVAVSLALNRPQENVLTGWPITLLGNLGLMLFFLILISAWLEYRQTNNELAAKIWRLQNRTQWLAEELDWQNRSVTESLLEKIQPNLRAVRESLAVGQLETAKLQIQLLVDAVIRPNSIDLAKSSFRAEPNKEARLPSRLKPKLLIKFLTRRVTARALFSTQAGLILGLVFLLPASTIVNSLAGALHLIGYLAMIGVLLPLLSRTSKTIKVPYVLLLALNVLVSVVFGIGHYLLGITFGLSDESGLHGFISLGIGLIFTGTGFTSLYLATKRVANQESAALAGELAASVAELNIRTLANRRRLALLVHGEMQALLQTIAIRLAKVQIGDSAELSNIDLKLSEAMDILAKPRQTAGQGAGLSQLRTQWDGVCEIALLISETADSVMRKNPGLAEVAYEICRERVINALKHSGAEAIDISIEATDLDLTIRTKNRDFAVNPKTSEGSGLGSDLLNQACTAWELKIQHQIVDFTAKIAIPAAEG